MPHFQDGVVFLLQVFPRSAVDVCTHIDCHRILPHTHIHAQLQVLAIRPREWIGGTSLHLIRRLIRRVWPLDVWSPLLPHDTGRTYHLFRFYGIPDNRLSSLRNCHYSAFYRP